jgi:hypothetical protein
MSVKELLEFKFNAEAYSRLAENLFDGSVEKEINNCAQNILKLIEGFSAKEIGSLSNNIDVDELFVRLKKKYNGDKGIRFSKNELRYASFYMQRTLNDVNFLKFLLIEFATRWSDLYLLGFIDFVLREWNHSSFEYRIVYETLKSVLKGYKGGIKRIQYFRDNLDVVDISGPAQLGLLWKSKGNGIKTITEYLELPFHLISYKYFTGAIVSYYRSNSNTLSIDNTELVEVLKEHGDSYTDKVVLSYIINRIPVSNGAEKNFYISAAKKFIGHYSNISAWKIPEAPRDIQSQVEKARCNIKAWQNSNLVIAFFDALVTDGSERKMFWLKYVDYIDDIKVFVPAQLRTTISYNQKLQDALRNSAGYSIISKGSTAAFVIMMQQFTLIEFSDIGALYVYNTAEKRKYINRSNIADVGVLKETYMSNLIDMDYTNYYFHDYGRLVHRGDWATRLNRWLRFKGLV